MNKYNMRTDLAIDLINNNIKSKEKNINGFIVTEVNLHKNNILNKKEGKYITISFNSINNKLIDTIIYSLKKVIKLKNQSFGLIVGLGNDKIASDSLGPKVIENILVTNHLYLLDELNPKYKRVSAINPGVMGETGIETKDIIESIVDKIKPDYLIVIDSLVSNSINRLNKTIQITNTGIHPGSGIGNKRKEISKDTLKIPVIAIGIPTVVDSNTIILDYLDKSNVKDIKMYKKLENNDNNLMVSTKEIDLIIKDLSLVISKSINLFINEIDKN